MANTLKKDVIIDLKVSDSEAVKNVADLDKHLAELKAEILKIQGAREMGKITEEEYYKQLAMTNAEIKLTKTSLAAYQKELIAGKMDPIVFVGTGGLPSIGTPLDGTVYAIEGETLPLTFTLSDQSTVTYNFVID